MWPNLNSQDLNLNEFEFTVFGVTYMKVTVFLSNVTLYIQM